MAVLLYIFRIALLIPCPFLRLGREKCWPTGLPQSPPLWHAHVSPLRLKRISLRSPYGVLLYTFPDYRDTECSETIPLLRENRYTPLRMPLTKNKVKKMYSWSNTCSLRRYLFILRRIYIVCYTWYYIYIYIPCPPSKHFRVGGREKSRVVCPGTMLASYY